MCKYSSMNQLDMYTIQRKTSQLCINSHKGFPEDLLLFYWYFIT